ncbi:MAG: hypothetical protein ACYTFW_21860 [Planctomycetota bacterium]|jgi:hypothetical protein
MVEIFQNFEQMATQFSPLVLIIPGAGAVLVGLFLWLGGLGFRRIIVAIAGAISGGIFGFFVIGNSIIPAAVSAFVAAAIAVIFERVFITILAAALAAAFGFAVLAGPYINNSQAANPANQDETSAQTTTLSVDESIETLKAYALAVGEKIKQSCSLMPVQRWAIIAVLVVIFILGGFYLWRLTSALCCSALGTMLIFVGMILLLLYKGTTPVNRICSQPLIYAVVFSAMTAFGTLEQLLLCRRVKTQPAGKEEAGKDKKDKKRTNKSKKDWRTT